LGRGGIQTAAIFYVYENIVNIFHNIVVAGLDTGLGAEIQVVL
jgi:hypothetical protein